MNNYKCIGCGQSYIPNRPSRKYCSMRCSNSHARGSIVDIFFSHIEKTSGCWLWKASKFLNGYGVFNSGPGRLAHRYSYLIHKGEIPKGMVVMHSCDVRHCVNPDHLSIGTTADNLHDMYAKNRQRKKETYTSGSDHHNALFTRKQVEQIRQLYKPRVFSLNKLAKKFGASKRCILGIIQHKTYQYV